MFGKNNKDRSPAYITSVMAIVGLIVFTAFPHTIENFSDKQAVAAEAIVEPTPTPKPNPFDSVVLQAKAAVVYDGQTHQILYKKDGNIPLPLASLTKIMTGITALEMNPATTTVVIQKENLEQDGDTGLLLGEQWDLTTLLKYSLVVSSNDGASAIGTALSSTTVPFVSVMNTEAQKIGLENSTFFNETGLDLDSSHAGAYGSAEDVAKMLLYAVENHLEIFRVTREPTISETSNSGIVHTGTNTDILTAKIPNLIAGKTGYTDLAGGNLAVAFDTDVHHTIVVAVLGSTYDGRFSDVNELVQATLEAVKN